VKGTGAPGILSWIQDPSIFWYAIGEKEAMILQSPTTRAGRELALMVLTGAAVAFLVSCARPSKVAAAGPVGGPPPLAYARPAGAFKVPDFPPGLTWFNVKQPLTMASLRGKMVLLDFWTYG